MLSRQPQKHALVSCFQALAALALLAGGFPLHAGDLQVYTSNEVSSVVAGATTTYDLTVSNVGATAKTGVAVAQVLDPAHFERLDWTCLPEFPAGHLQFGAQNTGFPGADSVARAGNFLYLSTPANDAIQAFSRHPTTGVLSVLGTKVNGSLEGDGNTVSGLDGVRALATSPDGAFLYALSPVDDAVVVLKIGVSGLLDWVELERDGVAGVDGLDQAAQLVVLAGHVYVSGSSDDAVAIFARNGTTGRLTYQGKVADGMPQGPLTIDGLDGAAGLVFSSGGEHLYVAGTVDGAVALFDRDALSGALTYRDVWRTSDAAGLAGAVDLVLAPDGSSLHVAGTGSLVCLPRDTAPGATFGELGAPLQQLHNGVAGLTGMAAPRSLTLSPDGAYLYLTSPPDNNVLAFVRDPRGPLTLLERRRDGEAPFEGLGGASGLVLAGTGAQLYVAGATDGAIVTLQRDDATFCTAGGADDTVSPGLQLSDTARLGVGGRLHYRVAARLRGSALGVPCVDPYDPDRRCVSSTASAAAGLDSGSSIDVDYLSREADLDVSISDGVSTAVPGETVVYQLDVDNLGPSDAAGVGVLSFFPHAVAAVDWTCAADGAGASCGLASGTDDIDFALATLPAGTGLRIAVTATLAAGGRGLVQTSARVLPPALLLDPDAANNTASDVDTQLAPVAELELAALSQPPFYAGAPVEVVLTLTNHGPSDALGVALSGLWPGLVEMAEFGCQPPTRAGTPSLLETVAALPGVSGVGLSPEGANLYATGQDGTVWGFRRDRKNGGLALLETLHEGDAYFDPVDNASGTIAGLNGARAALVSADGQHVYVASDVDDSVVLFRRVVPDGRLIYKASYRDGEAGVFGLGGASTLVASPAGDHLYVAGEADDAIAIFARNPTSGALSFLGAVQEGIDGLSGLLGVNVLAISADGRQLYAASPGAGGVTVFARAETGLLTWVETRVTTPPIGPGRGLAISADGANLYAAAGDAVVVLLRDAVAASPNFGRLTQLEALTEGDLQGGVVVGGLDDIGGISLSADGRQVYTRGQGAVGVFGRRVAELLAPGEAPGRLLCHELGSGSCVRPLAGDAEGLGAFAGENLYPPQGSAGELEVLQLAPGSRCLPLGAGQLADEIDVLAGEELSVSVRGRLLSSATGQVDFSALANPVAESDPGLLPNTASTSDPVLFKADLQLTKSDGVTTAIAGLPLSYTMTVSNFGPSDVHGITLEDVYPLFPSPPGGFTSGTLSWSCTGAAAAQWHQESRDGVAGVDGLAGALQMVASPDGAYVYVVGANEDAVAIFARDALTGDLSFVDVVRDGDLDAGRTVVGLDGAADLALSGDGDHLYVAGENADSLVVFSREAGSGALQYVQTVAAGIDGMEGAAAVLVSADGRFVYLAGKEEGTVVVFVRDPESGELAFLERERDGFGGVPAGVLLGARELLLTASERHLVVAAQFSDALAIFTRDPDDGSLTFLRALRDGDPQGEVAVDGLDMVFDLAESPDGRFLYTAALADDAISRFAWEDDGELSYLGILRHGGAGSQWLDGAAAVAMNPDGRYFFTAAANSDALSVFRRNDTSGEIERIEVLRQGQGGIGNLDNPRGLLAVGDDLYVSAASSNALLAVRLAPRAVCGRAGALGESSSPFDLDAGATVELASAGVVHPSARGNCDGDFQDLLSPLSAILPPGVLDETLPNLVTDGDDLRGHVDLSLSLTDNQVSVAAGTPVSYTLVVRNLGAPSNSLGARVVGSTSGNLVPDSWTCTAGAGAVCAAAAGTGALDVGVDLELGSEITIQIFVSVLASATGTAQQRVDVLPGPCETDLVPASNVVTDRNAVIRVADLAISKTGPDEAEPGQVIFFEIVASNLGPSDAEGRLTDLLPSTLRRAAWSCAGSGGAVCPLPPMGNGNLDVPVVLPAMSQATFTVAAEVEIAALGSLVNEARIAPAITVIDALQANNTSSAEVVLLDVVIFHDGFESGDTAAWETFGLMEEQDDANPR